MAQENVEFVRQVFNAWNRGDLDWLLNHTTPEFEFRTARLFPDLEAVYRGREGFRRFWNTFRPAWKFVRVEIERIEQIADGRVLVLFRFHGRGRDGVEVERDYAQLFTFDDGMLSQVVGFAEPREALAAAGLSE
jgi:ketosteroid isomerase-like protein